jgi:hypothetical protein
MRATVKDVRNAWGWNGAKDRDAYEVYVDGKLWGRYCYACVAMDVATRIDKLWDDTRTQDESESLK